MARTSNLSKLWAASSGGLGSIPGGELRPHKPSGMAKVKESFFNLKIEVAVIYTMEVRSQLYLLEWIFIQIDIQIFIY